jgi:WD40 repeat protein
MSGTPATSIGSITSTPISTSSAASTPINTSANSSYLSSTSTILLNTNRSVNTLFNKVCNLLLEMQSDPHPDVAQLAKIVVIDLFIKQRQNFDHLKQTIINNSINQFKQKHPNKIDLLSAAATLSNHQNKNISLNEVNGGQMQINTEFVPWCCKYFLRPLLSFSTSSDQDSNVSVLHPLKPSENGFLDHKTDLFDTESLDMHCRLLYNYKRKKMPIKWTETLTMQETFHSKHISLPVHCKFHPYENQLFVADEDMQITVYDTSNLIQSTSNNNSSNLVMNSARSKLLQFSNSKQKQQQSLNQFKKPKITSFNLINVKHEPIVLTGTYDRTVRFWRPDLLNFTKETELITAFTAFSDSEKRESNFEAGLIMEWSEENERLYCTGDTSFIRIWDMNKEQYKDYSTQVQSCVFSLSASENYTVAGFGDGTVKLFDFRQKNPSTINNNNNNITNPLNIMRHESFVRKVHIHKATNKLVTASVSGDIFVFDLRNLSNLSSKLIKSEHLTALECHLNNELIAA